LDRKQLHGHLQQKRKKQIEINVESQKCAHEKYIVKYPTIFVHNDVNPNKLFSTAENLENEQVNRSRAR